MRNWFTCTQIIATSSFWIKTKQNFMVKKVWFTCVVDQGWSDSKIQLLNIVLLYLNCVEMSWAVKYLDKPQWRVAVSLYKEINRKVYFCTLYKEEEHIFWLSLILTFIYKYAFLKNYSICHWKNRKEKIPSTKLHMRSS